MLDNTMIVTRIDICKIRKHIALFLAVSMVLIFALSLDVHAAGKVKAYGTLTSIEDDGSVIINEKGSEKGYFMSPSADVLNYQGRHILLSDLPPSSYVQFEYEQTTRGFVIFFIKEIPQ